MRVDQQDGYVLHARAYRETSLLVESFTRDYGRVAFIARSVRGERSRFSRSLLQPFQSVSLSWVIKGELATLTAIEGVDSPLALSGESLLCAMYVNELLLRLTARNDSYPEAYDAYEHCLERLSNESNHAWALRCFERDLLKYLGYGLVLDHEPDSGLPIVAGNQYVYQVEHGPRQWQPGLVGARIDGAGLLALHTDCIPIPEHLSALKRLLRSVIAHHLGGTGLRAWALWQDMPAK